MLSRIVSFSFSNALISFSIALVASSLAFFIESVFLSYCLEIHFITVSYFFLVSSNSLFNSLVASLADLAALEPFLPALVAAFPAAVVLTFILDILLLRDYRI